MTRAEEEVIRAAKLYVRDMNSITASHFEVTYRLHRLMKRVYLLEKQRARKSK